MNEAHFIKEMSRPKFWNDEKTIIERVYRLVPPHRREIGGETYPLLALIAKRVEAIKRSELHAIYRNEGQSLGAIGFPLLSPRAVGDWIFDEALEKLGLEKIDCPICALFEEVPHA